MKHVELIYTFQYEKNHMNIGYMEEKSPLLCWPPRGCTRSEGSGIRLLPSDFLAFKTLNFPLYTQTSEGMFASITAN